MMSTIGLLLRQNGSICIVRSVSLHAKCFLRISVNKDGSLTDLPLEDFESGLLVFSSVPFMILLEQGMEGFCHIGKP
jgi:hypothetical protein